MHSFREYYMLMERIGWRLTDFDWDAIDLEHVTEDDRLRARETAITESGVPHYSGAWGAVEGIESCWELRQFASLWAGEEHRHSEGLRLLCEKIGVDAEPEFDAVTACDFVERQNESSPTGCYNTIAGLLTYTTMQELATWKFYQCWSKATQSSFIRALTAKIAADEMRHHQWFANALQRHLGLAEDPDAYRRNIVEAISAFHMPHNYYPVEFPFFDAPEPTYFSAKDLQQMRDKITQIVMFDGELVSMLLEIGPEALVSGIGNLHETAA